MSSKVRRRAVELLKVGRKTEARQLLALHIRENPQDELARQWYLEAFHRDKQAVKATGGLDSTNNKAKATQAKIEHHKLTESAGNSDKKRAIHPALTVSVVTLIVFLCGLTSLSIYLNISLEGELATFQNRFQNLQENYRQLNDKHQELSETHDRIKDEYDKAIIDLNSLHNQHKNLQNEYAAVVNEYNSLVGRYNELGQEYGNLSDEYTQFRTRSVAPPYVYIHGRSVELAYMGAGDTFVRWQIPFESLEASIIRGHNSRNNSGAVVRLSISEQESAQLLDFRPYVDPQPFNDVIPQLYAQTERKSDFIWEVWQIIAQLTAYSNEIEETPRFPLETLLAAGGDCEDTAILFASMIMAAPVDWEISLVYMDINNPTDPKIVNHVIVQVDTGAEVFLVETTSKFTMNPYPNGVMGWYFPIDG